WPSPQEIADSPVGRTVLDGASWKGRKSLVAAATPAKTARPVKKATKAAIPPGEQAARDRQALVDKARSTHTAIAEVEELLANGASDRALSHSITARGKLGTPPEIQDRL